MIGRELKKERVKQKATLKQVAESCGTSIARIHETENEKTEPSLNLAIRICDALGVKLSTILRRAGK
ncbi:MAG: hypothetical protein CL946_04710 [Ectothiorhodospiraceae bacterium]|nr:hypothetical protein [Ectothiorhodospiraceae bacterium]|tara:strand:+ start:81 stop:281 length:201 start_codon:yes stop_codon:yes gene_type:complete